MAPFGRVDVGQHLAENLLHFRWLKYVPQDDGAILLDHRQDFLGRSGGFQSGEGRHGLPRSAGFLVER